MADGPGCGFARDGVVQHPGQDSTKAEWDEVVREIVRMWEQFDYSYEDGVSFTVPGKRSIHPKPYGHAHPPIWVACDNPATFSKAGSLGIGAIAFNFEPIYNLKGRIEAYKEAAADPVEIIGDYQNNNVMMTNSVICLSDRKRAREIALSKGRGYIVTMVNLYHDTMPKSADARTWPVPPVSIRDFGGEELLDQLIEGGHLLCGTPEEVCEQVEAYRSVGCDQLVFGIADGMTHEENLEMIELFGDQVIPEFDKNPEHSTVAMRASGVRKYPELNEPADPHLKVEVLPAQAIIPLTT